MIIVRAASREALREFKQQVDDVASSAGADALAAIAGDLYDIAAVLAGQPQLRRLAGDPATDPQRRTALLAGLFGGKVSAGAVDLAGKAAAYRWSSPWDLTDALEIAGDRLLLDLADQQSKLITVEDEVFRFGRIVDANDNLRSLLDELVVPAERRVTLLHGVLDGKADAITVQLLDHAVRTGRKRSIVLAVDDLLDDAADRRQRSTAYVRAPLPLSDRQQNRLTAALSRLFGRDIDVRTEVDPRVRGGLVVRVGDEIIDGSVATRVAAVRGALTS